jgi:beta-galactosidase
MYYGSAWYPEQWPEERWAVDLELMRQAGMNVVRTGEYAWPRLEPSEGRFTLDWLHRLVDLAAKYQVQVILATPSDAPPAWMTQKYPDVLRVTEDGTPTRHGGRRHFNPSSPRYREMSAKIAGVMAERFGKHPNVIGWQIANEFCMYSYDEITRKAFQDWLRSKYGSLDELNRRWTTTYWAQEYTDWSQIHCPVGWQNPCMDIEFFRFTTQAYVEFQRYQVNAIRTYAEPRQWISHNFHMWEDLDWNELGADLDLAGFDPYPGSHRIDYAKLGWWSDYCRTVKPARRHWILETQPGQTNWAPPNAAMPRGAIRAQTWHMYAHGAEGVMYWQWRSPFGGQEQYHGTLIAPDGSPRPSWGEFVQAGEELRKLAPKLETLRVEADAAVLYAFADQYAIKRQKHNPGFDPLQHCLLYYRPLREMPLNVDVVSIGAELARYKLLVAPHVHLMDGRIANKLLDYVRDGGHLLLGARTGFKDDVNALLPQRQPGNILAEALGAYVEEYQSVDTTVSVEGPIGKGTCTIWAEYFIPKADDVEILLTYGPYNGWIDDRPAMVSRKFGKGRITYLGTWPDAELMTRIIAWTADQAGVRPVFPRPPRDVEVCRLSGEKETLHILINHANEPQRVDLPDKSAITLAPHAVHFQW